MKQNRRKTARLKKTCGQIVTCKTLFPIGLFFRSWPQSGDELVNISNQGERDFNFLCTFSL